MANVYIVFIFVVLVNRWFVENVVQAEMNAETVFEFLSRRLDNMLVETASLKSRVQELESQCKANKNEEITKVTESTHLVERKLDNMAHEREVISLKETAQAVRNMVYVEKRLLRETVENVNSRLADLDSKLVNKIASFDEYIENELLKVNASLDARGRQMHDVINDMSIKANNNITQMTVDLQVASDDLVMKLESHIQEQRARVAEVELNLKSSREEIPVIKASIEKYIEEKFNSCSSRISSMKKIIGYVEIGDRVVRGRDWKWDSQDGNGAGTVTGHYSTPGWVYVKWDKGVFNANYRNGAEGSYDLRII